LRLLFAQIRRICAHAQTVRRVRAPRLFRVLPFVLLHRCDLSIFFSIFNVWLVSGNHRSPPVLGWARDEPRRVCDVCIKPIEAQLSLRARAEPVISQTTKCSSLFAVVLISCCLLVLCRGQ
jgi:hypothetical protein